MNMQKTIVAPAEEDTLEVQKEVWRREQLRIASLVDAYPDKYPDGDNNGRDNRFRFVPMKVDDHHQQQQQQQQQEQQQQPQKQLLFGGVDVSFPEKETDLGVAVYVIIDAVTMRENHSKKKNKAKKDCVVYMDHEYFPVNEVPYISSYLAFREIKPIERLINKQKQVQPNVTPNAILVDGNGIFHARRAGIACFVGVRTNIPTIGIGKSIYCEGGLTNSVVLDGIQQSLQSILETMITAKTTNGSSSSSSDNETDDNHDCYFVNGDDVIIMDQQSICAGNNNPPLRIAEEKSTKREEDQQESQNVQKEQDAIVMGRDTLVQQLAPYCSGIGIPLQVNDKKRSVLACALVGHGGNVGNKNKTAKKVAVGTKNPIYVSVGHKISLLDAVRISAFLSIARIPEPVRQADLIGRELLRQKQQQQQQEQQEQQQEEEQEQKQEQQEQGQQEQEQEQREREREREQEQQQKSSSSGNNK